MAQPGGDAAQISMNPQAGMMSAPEADRGESGDGEAGGHPQNEVSKAEISQSFAASSSHNAAASTQPAARKTVSSKSTPTDDASEASTNEAAISEFATPSPSDSSHDSKPNTYPAYSSPGPRSPSWRSPAIRPDPMGKSPSDDLSLASDGRSLIGSGVGCGGKGVVSRSAPGSAGLPALVASNSGAATPATKSVSSMSPSEDTEMSAALHPPHTAANTAASATESTSEADTVAARLRQNLGLKTASAPAPARASAATADDGAVRSSDYLPWLISNISPQLPTEGRAQLSAAMKQYSAGDLSPAIQPFDASTAQQRTALQQMTQQSIDALVATTKGLCQKYGLSIPACPHAAAAAGGAVVSQAGVAAKQEPRAPKARPPATGRGAGAAAATKAAAATAKTGRAAQDRRELNTGNETKRRKGVSYATASTPATRPASEPAARAAAGAGTGAGAGEEESLVARLVETPLCTHLTSALARVAADEKLAFVPPAQQQPQQPPVIVRVVGEARTSSGGYLHRSKSIMAFQEDEAGKEVVLLALYVNEFGADAPPPNTGRIYVECMDGVPLRRGERGLQREATVARIVSAYLEYVRRLGFSFVHFRSPPPHDDHCQIFARRPDEQRVTWTLYMTRWIHRILKYAQANGTFHSYTCGSHGSILNFPPTLMTAGHLGLEASFGALEARLTSRQPMSVSSRRALLDRLFVVRLQATQCAGMVPSSPAHGGAIVSPCTFAALRTGLTKMLLQRRLAFHTMQHAFNSSHVVLMRLIEEQEDDACYQRTHSSHAANDAARSHQRSRPPGPGPAWGGGAGPSDGSSDADLSAMSSSFLSLNPHARYVGAPSSSRSAAAGAAARGGGFGRPVGGGNAHTKGVVGSWALRAAAGGGAASAVGGRSRGGGGGEPWGESSRRGGAAGGISRPPLPGRGISMERSDGDGGIMSVRGSGLPKSDSTLSLGGLSSSGLGDDLELGDGFHGCGILGPSSISPHLSPHLGAMGLPGLSPNLMPAADLMGGQGGAGDTPMAEAALDLGPNALIGAAGVKDLAHSIRSAHEFEHDGGDGGFLFDLWHSSLAAGSSKSTVRTPARR